MIIIAFYITLIRFVVFLASCRSILRGACSILISYSSYAFSCNIPLFIIASISTFGFSTLVVSSSPHSSWIWLSLEFFLLERWSCGSIDLMLMDLKNTHQLIQCQCSEILCFFYGHDQAVILLRWTLQYLLYHPLFLIVFSIWFELFYHIGDPWTKICNRLILLHFKVLQLPYNIFYLQYSDFIYPFEFCL